jgi:phage baseplate assembly protein V
MSSQIESLVHRVAALERLARGNCRQGTVAQVDPAAGTVRLRFGGNEHGDYLSAPIPYAQTAGAMRIHSPPSVGQQMMTMAPGGDLRQAIAMPLGFSSATPSPSGAGNQHVMTFGSATLTLSAGSLTIKIGGSTVVIDASGLTVNGNLVVAGGGVTNNGKDIGSTHTHGGIRSGGSSTSPPN